MSSVEHNANCASNKIMRLHQEEMDEINHKHVHAHGVDPLHTSHKEVQVKKAPVAHGHSGAGKPAASPAEGAAAAAVKPASSAPAAPAKAAAPAKDAKKK